MQIATWPDDDVADICGHESFGVDVAADCGLPRSLSGQTEVIFGPDGPYSLWMAPLQGAAAVGWVKIYRVFAS
jgi:hypothetical protein